MLKPRSFRPRPPRQHSPEGVLNSLLDPIDRLAESVFSILILLTFTMAFRVIVQPDAVEAGSLTQGSVYDLAWAAIAAVLAWAFIDGLMYALFSLFERGERHRLLMAIHSAEDERVGLEAIAEELDDFLEPITTPEGRQSLYRSIHGQLMQAQPRPIGFARYDFTGALAHVLVALISVLPALIPLVVLSGDPGLAILVSNLISFIVLFVVGYRWGMYTGTSPWRTALLLTGMAVAIVLIAIPLGG